MRMGQAWRMLRHLRPAQLGWRLWYRLRRPLFASAWWDRHVLSRAPSQGLVIAPPLPLSPGDPVAGDAIASGRIRLLGVDNAVDDWNATDKSHLWRFTLHYFEWLADLAAAGRPDVARALVADWIARHRRPDPLAWHPYPLSLRLFAWLGHAEFLLAGADPAFASAFVNALGRQAAHLAQVPERDVGGNHLIKNLKALVAAGLCLGTGTTAWLAELKRQLTRQILPDGMHFERSPTYHVQVLTDLVELRAVLAKSGAVPHWLDDTIAAMAPAFRCLRHGDGRLALFNDGAEGDPALLAALDARLPPGPPATALKTAGYWRLVAGPALVILDAGRLAPDDLPAHAHADALSFELSWGDERIVVNGGTYAYQDERWRPYFRGTASHSTVLVGQQDQAELFGTFRLGRRPRDVSGTGTGHAVRAHHDGYAHLGVIHRRALALAEDALTGEDRLDGPLCRAEARFHLHPGVTLRQADEGLHLITSGGHLFRFTAGGARISHEPGWYAPAFGRMEPITTLVVSLAGNHARWRFDLPVAHREGTQ